MWYSCSTSIDDCLAHALCNLGERRNVLVLSHGSLAHLAASEAQRKQKKQRLERREGTDGPLAELNYLDFGRKKRRLLK
ncbi:hypothetical protein PFLUV_G00034630 [Perca fluviatilis]|uniref:Uncharacterized protein n=1 Tax=Perca fluviatilis TaxID=8168 RepID=A0A6A5FFI5_PERFL|nr:hypothetical protein PFLUV_G00034630 [Perca fluviatilis]